MTDVLHDATVSVGALTNGANAVTNLPLTIAANSNRYLLVHICIANQSAAIPNSPASVVWQGVPLTKLWEYPTAAGTTSGAIVSAWGLKNPAAGAANVVITNAASLTGTAANNSAIAGSYYNVDQTTPVNIPSLQAVGSNSRCHAVVQNVPGGLAVGAMCRAWDAAASPTVVTFDSVAIFQDVQTSPVTQVGGTSIVQGGSSGLLQPNSPLYGNTAIHICVTEHAVTAEQHSSVTPGWTKIDEYIGAKLSVSVWASNTEAFRTVNAAWGPTITWATACVRCSLNALVYRDTWRAPTKLGAVNTGTASPHTSPGGTTAFDRSLAVYMDAALASSTGLAVPAGWTEDNDDGGATSCRQAQGSKPMAAIGNTGAISVVGSATEWFQQQYEFAGGPLAVLRTSRVSNNARSILAVWEEAGEDFNTVVMGVSSGAGTNASGGLCAGACVALLPVANPPVTITPTLFVDADTFGTERIGITYKPTHLTDGETFGAPSLRFNKNIFPAHFLDPDTFGTPTIKILQRILPPLFVDPDTFGSPTIIRTQKILPAIFADPDSFGTPKIRMTIKPTLFVDADTFGSPTVTVTGQPPKPARFIDPDTFGVPKLRMTLHPVLFVDPDTFGSPTVRQMNFVRPTRYIDPDLFGTHNVDFPEPFVIKPQHFLDPDTFYPVRVRQSFIPVPPGSLTPGIGGPTPGDFSDEKRRFTRSKEKISALARLMGQELLALEALDTLDHQMDALAAFYESQIVPEPEPLPASPMIGEPSKLMGLMPLSREQDDEDAMAAAMAVAMVMSSD
jgi:hypothetical protein